MQAFSILKFSDATRGIIFKLDFAKFTLSGETTCMVRIVSK